jgi:hypothetical protein
MYIASVLTVRALSTFKKPDKFKTQIQENIYRTEICCCHQTFLYPAVVNRGSCEEPSPLLSILAVS